VFFFVVCKTLRCLAKQSIKMNMYSLKVSQICKHYGGTLLFKDISFELRPGEVLAITGWNGSGKSTLLRIIAGLVRPSLGKVEMFFKDEPISKEARRKFVGMVAPALALYDELTALENMEFFCRVRGIAYDRQSCLDMMARVGLTENANKMCRNYSSGMKQRLKIVQALLHKPPLLLLDEPGCNLDSKGMEIVEEVILEQRQAGVTVIASNEKREVDYADRAINLSE
jgi:heme exporter protein A